MQRILSHGPLHQLLTTLTGLVLVSSASAAELTGQQSESNVAREIDRLIQAEHAAAGVQPAPLAADEDFLRRVTFDIAGTLPQPRDVTLFGLNPSRSKRTDAVEKLLGSDEYAETWARYWRDVIFSKATNMRAGFVNQSFIRWMTESLKENNGWDDIAQDMITASGDVRENGDTALVFVHEGSAEDIAGEVSRIFLGIQMQCANCHDHPWDRWKRDQFHELAAFFPRIRLQPVREEMRTVTYNVVSVTGSSGPANRREQLLQNLDRLFRFLDRNQDGKLTKVEAQRNPNFGRNFQQILDLGDKNKDGGLTKAEFRELPAPPANQPGRGSMEHFMADLLNPSSPGTQIDPKFFVTGVTAKAGLADLERRDLLSKYITSTRNEWFARAIVNRMWAEMTGEGFYMPIDDMGPDRTPSFPEVLDLLSEQFVQNGYDLQWLMKTIAMTQTYQRQIRPTDPSGEVIPFASATPTRLRGDQLYNAIMTSLTGNTQIANPRQLGRNMAGGGMYRGARNPRDAFSQLFGFDPSTPQADITGNVPQALFMMNSPMLNNQINASGFTRLSGLLRKFPDNEDAINELYVMILAREPSEKELGIFKDYLAEVGNRNEAFEDLMWSLMNSSEFLSKR